MVFLFCENMNLDIEVCFFLCAGIGETSSNQYYLVAKARDSSIIHRVPGEQAY